VHIPNQAQPEPNRAQIPKVGALRKLRPKPMDIDREARAQENILPEAFKIL
jgi:hypothetical protein